MKTTSFAFLALALLLVGCGRDVAIQGKYGAPPVVKAVPIPVPDGLIPVVRSGSSEFEIGQLNIGDKAIVCCLYAYKGRLYVAKFSIALSGPPEGWNVVRRLETGFEVLRFNGHVVWSDDDIGLEPVVRLAEKGTL